MTRAEIESYENMDRTEKRRDETQWKEIESRHESYADKVKRNDNVRKERELLKEIEEDKTDGGRGNREKRIEYTGNRRQEGENETYNRSRTMRYKGYDEYDNRKEVEKTNQLDMREKMEKMQKIIITMDEKIKKP